MKKVNICGVGKYLPVNRLNNSALERIVETTDDWIQQKIGIAERRIAIKESVVEMGLHAALAAIQDAGIDREEVDMIVCSSTSFDKRIPTLANYISDELGINNALCLDINAGGCCNYLASILTAIGYLNSNCCNTVLCLVADKCSDFVDWSDRSTCVIFGDGAAAAIIKPVQQGNGIIYFKMTGEKKDSLILPVGQTLEYEETMLKMNGKDIFTFAVAKGTESIINGCTACGITVEEVDMYIFHQANLNIIKNIMSRIGLDMSRTHIILDKYGNTAGSSVGIALVEAVDEGKIKKGDRVAMVTFGGGLNWGIIILEWG